MTENRNTNSSVCYRDAAQGSADSRVCVCVCDMEGSMQPARKKDQNNITLTYLKLKLRFEHLILSFESERFGLTP